MKYPRLTLALIIFLFAVQINAKVKPIELPKTTMVDIVKENHLLITNELTRTLKNDIKNTFHTNHDFHSVVVVDSKDVHANANKRKIKTSE